MTAVAPHLDTIRCKHCDAIVALLPVARLRGRAVVECPYCTTVRVIRPPDPLKPSIDEPLVISYTNAVPA